LRGFRALAAFPGHGMCSVTESDRSPGRGGRSGSNAKLRGELRTMQREGAGEGPARFTKLAGRADRELEHVASLSSVGARAPGTGGAARRVVE